MQLSEHFSLEELTASDKARELGIDNSASSAVITNLKLTADDMEYVRKLLGNKPISITSGYRCPALNVAVRGVKTSAHCFGFAVDFTCPQFGSVYETAKFLSESGLKYDQLIYEYVNWVHISFDPRMRGENLTIFNSAQGYLPGIVQQG
jgi:zinc D-Ala-D-Ala carboxypeptidase